MSDKPLKVNRCVCAFDDDDALIGECGIHRQQRLEFEAKSKYDEKEIERLTAKLVVANTRITDLEAKIKSATELLNGAYG